MRRVIGILLSMLVLSVVAGCRSTGRDDFTTAATIGGYPVALGEVKMFLNEYSQDPVQSALNELVPFIVARRELARLGGETFATFEEFQGLWHAENARRELALEQGEVVYGPESLSQRVYYSYLHESNIKQLAGLMAPELSEGELRAAYDERTELFNLVGSVDMRVMLLGPDDNPGVVDILREALSGGESYDGAVERLGFGEMTFPRTFSEQDFRHPDVTEFDGVSDAIRHLQAGEFWEPIDNGGEGWIILYCEKRDGGGREPFEEARITLAHILREENFERDFAALVDEAVIEADEWLYKEITNSQ